MADVALLRGLYVRARLTDGHTAVVTRRTATIDDAVIEPYRFPGARRDMTRITLGIRAHVAIAFSDR